MKVSSEIFIKEKYTEKTLPSCKDAKVGLGAVEVIEKVTGYKKIRYFSEIILGEYPLEMPKLSLETMALWIELPDRFTDLVEKHNLDFAGGIHAIEHAMIAMYPLHLLADRSDVGGVSTPNHNDLQGNCGIFVYDGHHGGVGYAERGYEIITDILEVTLKAIKGCPCSDGCPSCIQSPKCGNHNNPLDKHAAIMILHELLAKLPYVPPKLKSQKTPINKQGKIDVPESIGTALDRVRSQLRRNSLKQKEPITKDSSQKYKNSVSPEEKKILDRIKQIEEMQRQNESKKKEDKQLE